MTEPSTINPPQWGWWVAVVFVLQILFFWAVSETVQKKDSISTPLKLESIEDDNLLARLALEDPVALSRPNKYGFSSFWLKTTPEEYRLTQWVPRDIPLPQESNLVVNVMGRFLEEGPSKKMRSYVKPLPKLTRVSVPRLGMRNSSRLELHGDISKLIIEQKIILPSDWVAGKLLKESRVQVVVDGEGRVMNGALIRSSGHAPADQKAIDIALRDISFGNSTNDLVIGDLVFYWHTDLASITNIVEQLR